MPAGWRNTLHRLTGAMQIQQEVDSPDGNGRLWTTALTGYHLIRVESLAKRVGMSSSAFHLHFKGVTAMSPLQYQKRLRLLAHVWGGAT